MAMDHKERAKTASYLAVGWEFSLSTAVGIVGGYFLDRWLDTTPWLMLAGIGFGLAAGFRRLLQFSRQVLREAEEEEPPGE